MSLCLYDTHVHLEKALASGGLGALVKRACDAGVCRMLAVGGSVSMNAAALNACETYPDLFGAAIGFDRDHVDSADQDSLAAYRRQILAIGEIRLDYHYIPETADAQKALFDRQLALAREWTLPVIVHSREADANTLEMLAAHAAQWNGAPGRIGVLHCYTGGRTFAEALVDLGCYISFSGILTFRNADPLREVSRELPLDRIMIETDTPYLAPVPHRGKPNEPAYVRDVAACLAELKNVSLEEIAETTRRNAVSLFGA
jgi:TatD DNase family protein